MTMRTGGVGVECCAMAMVALIGQAPSEGIRGRVVDDRGQPVAAAIVTLTCAGSSSHAVSDERGDFAFPAGASPVACELVASAAGRTARVEAVRQGSYTQVRLHELTPLESGSSPRASEATVQAARIRARMSSGARPVRPKWEVAGWPGQESANQDWAGQDWADRGLPGSGSAFGFTPRGALQAPGAFDQQGWSVGITARRRIPGGIDVTGSFGAHRRPDALSATVTDLVGSDRSLTVPVTPFFDPSRSMTYWETKVRVERGFTWHGLELRTLLEAHAEFAPSRQGLSTLLPAALEQQASSALRGRTLRFGLVLAF